MQLLFGVTGIFQVQLLNLPEDFFAVVSPSENFLVRNLQVSGVLNETLTVCIIIADFQNLFSILESCSEEVQRRSREFREVVQSTLESRHGVILHASLVDQLLMMGVIDSDGHVIQGLDDEDLPVVVLDQDLE